MNSYSKITLAAVVLVAPTLSSVLLGADAFGYAASSAVPYSYVDIGGTGTYVLSNTDDGTATLNIPFPFKFYGTSYNNICVSTNGLLSFGACVPDDVTNLDLTVQAPSGNQPLIAPFWSDLTFSSRGAGAVVYQTLGISGARQFVVQWKNVAALNIPGGLDFQAVLNEGSNTVLFQYKNVESASSAVNKGAGATVGIRGPNSLANSYRTQWSFDAPVLSNNLAIRFTPPADIAAVDVSSKVSVTTSAFVLNRLRGTYSGSITIKNTSATALQRPLTLLLLNLSAGISVLNPLGTLAGQGPYLAVPGSSALAPNQSATISIEFTNTGNARTDFVVKTYSGNF